MEERDGGSVSGGTGQTGSGPSRRAETYKIDGPGIAGTEPESQQEEGIVEAITGRGSDSGSDVPRSAEGGTDEAVSVRTVEDRREQKGGQQVKKGKPTWRPATMMDVPGKDPSKTYKFIDKTDPNRVYKHIQEGWTFSDEPVTEAGRIHDGKPLTSVTEYRELALMEMPIEGKQEREEYYAEKADAQVKDIKKKFQRELNTTGDIKPEAYGRIIIE